VTSGRREATIVLLGFAALAVLFTFPLTLHLGSVGRIDNGDGQFSIWNVAWVARALVLDPVHVLDANIFYPHRGTLTYSETNLGAGALAVPIYWTTGNAYAAHNVVLLLSFVLGGSILTFVLSPLLVVALALAAVVSAIVVFDGESIWLEGIALIGLYCIIAASFWWG